MRNTPRVLTFIALALFLCLLWFIVMFIVNDYRLSREVRSIQRWVEQEIPRGSTLDQTRSVLLAHGMRQENMYYSEKSKIRYARYPKPRSIVRPIGGGIYLEFHFDAAERRAGTKVYKAYDSF